MYKTIPMFAVAATLVAAVVLGLSSVPTVKADPPAGSFGAAVSDQAKHNQGAFGEHQSTVARESGGLGQFNCKTCTPLK
jgi:hypothetical protein